MPVTTQVVTGITITTGITRAMVIGDPEDTGHAGVTMTTTVMAGVGMAVADITVTAMAGTEMMAVTAIAGADMMTVTAMDGMFPAALAVASTPLMPRVPLHTFATRICTGTGRNGHELPKPEISPAEHALLAATSPRLPLPRPGARGT